ncbi:MAG: hypothetical protein EXS36_00120 [Pedosphaera sp.]|nr:hypothetical protein [Pedosphaera sp.]
MTLPETSLHRSDREFSYRVRNVPPPPIRPWFLGHNRLRRTSAISHFTLAAALEAMGIGGDADVCPLVDRLGIVFCAFAGCVNYTRRFFDETLRDPSTASPLIFPETVFNAPASHLAAILGAKGPCYTLVRDQSAFVYGLQLAAEWLTDDWVDDCLVVASEEVDWLTADALRHFSRGVILGEGAGAVRLRHEKSSLTLDRVTAIVPCAGPSERRQAVRQVRALMRHPDGKTALSDGLVGCDSYDRAEAAAWSDWAGPRISAKALLGEGLAAGSAWQCLAALELLQSTPATRAWVPVIGMNQQAVAAAWRRLG